MITFQDQYESLQRITGDYEAARKAVFKKDLNTGGSLFSNQLGRKFNREYLTADLEATRRYYQFSGDVLRVSDIRILNGSDYYTPILVANEEDWNDLTSTSTTSSLPTHYFIRGFKEVGIYPTPSNNVDNGMEIGFEPQPPNLSQDDFSAGAVTVNVDSVIVTHSASGFTEAMIGRGFEVTDGSDTRWYRIASFQSASQVSLENFYEGISGGGRSFRIGEVMKIPEGYYDAPEAYALQRYYKEMKNTAEAKEQETYFKRQLKSARQTYGRSTSRMGVKANARKGRRPRWIDLTPPVNYP
jgi:hypothetical protein